jgi:thiaminase
MAKVWKAQDIEVYRTWIRALYDEASDDLSDWENTFVDNVATQLLNNRNLTEGQAEKLEQIYAKHTK